MSGVNQEFGQKAFNPYGGGDISFWDTYLSAWSRPSKITNIRYTPSTEHADQTQVTRGEEVVTQRRVRVRRGSLSFVMAENMSPEVIQMILGDQEVAQTMSGDQTGSEVEMITLYGTEKQKFQLEDSHAAQLDATYYAAPTISTATPSATTNGFWDSTGTYYLFAVPVWGDPTGVVANTATGYTAGLDINFWAGAPSAGKSVTITNNNDTVSVTMAAYSNTPLDQPDYWVCFANTSDTIVGSKVAWIDGTAQPGDTYRIFTDADTFTINGNAATAGGAVNTAVYAAAVGCGVQRVDTYAATPVYTKLISGTDFTYDSANGTIQRITNAGWTDGDSCRVTYWVWKPDSVTTTMGARSSGTTTRKVRVRHFETEVDKTSTDPTTIEGVEIIIDRVDFSGPSTEIAFNDDGFAEGMPVDVECMYDQTNDRIGTITSFSRKLAGLVTSGANYR